MKSRLPRGRSIVLVALGLTIGVTMMASPAAGHVGGTVGHLVRHLDDFFYKKGQSEARYVNVDEAAGGALSGTYPNPTIADGAVGGNQIANGAVGSSKIGGGQISSFHVLDGGLGSADIFDGAIGSADIANDAVRASDLGTVNVRIAQVAVPGGTVGNGDYHTEAVTAECLPGEQILGGGAGWAGAENIEELELPIISSRPDTIGTHGWFARGGNDGLAGEATLSVHALCLGV